MTDRPGHRTAPMAIAAAVAMWVGGVWASPEAAGGQATNQTNAAVASVLRARGLELGYNLDHADALAAFRAALDADPNDPAAYRLAAAAVWIDLLFEQGAITVDDYLGQARANLARRTPSPALVDAFHDFLRRAVSLSEAQLQEQPSSADAHYQVGAAYGFLASYTATIEGRLMGSFGPARRAYHEHERALVLDRGRKDAGLIVGMYRYAVSTLPGPLRLLARLAGFGGDSKRGVRLVEDAARYPTEVQPNALFVLTLMYNREARYDDALRVIEELKQRFPRNRLLYLEAGNTLLRAGRPGDAKAALEEGLARLSTDSRPRALGEEARWRHAYGAALVELKEIEAAERELRMALAGATHDWVRGRIHQELGKVADLAGDRRQALDEYRTADRLCRVDHDGVCSDEVKKLIKTRHR